jgi:hypothetical protein
MNKIKGFKTALDIVMTVLFLLLMKVSITGIALHELIGIGIFFLFAAHKLLNYKWISGVFKGIAKGKSTARALFMLALDAVILLLVTLNVISGVLISQTIFTGVAASNITGWSNLHHIAAYSSLVLLSVHIGLHWQMLINIFKKLLGLNTENPVRTLIARAALIIIAVMGIRAISKPAIYENFTAPFSSQTALPVQQSSAQSITASKKDEEDTDTAALTQLSSNSLEVDVPTLEEYLSRLRCSGCGKHCLLTALRCNKGTRFKNAAIADYEEAYSQSDTEEAAAPSEDTTITEAETASNDLTGSMYEAAENETSLLDFTGLMGLVIAGTHYTLVIPQKRKAQKKSC